MEISTGPTGLKGGLGPRSAEGPDWSPKLSTCCPSVEARYSKGRGPSGPELQESYFHPCSLGIIRKFRGSFSALNIETSNYMHL